MAVSVVLSKAQDEFLLGLGQQLGEFRQSKEEGKCLYVPRYPSSRTGMALFKKGFVNFNYGIHRWVLTEKGIQYLRLKVNAEKLSSRGEG